MYGEMGIDSLATWKCDDDLDLNELKEFSGEGDILGVSHGVTRPYPLFILVSIVRLLEPANLKRADTGES